MKPGFVTGRFNLDGRKIGEDQFILFVRRSVHRRQRMDSLVRFGDVGTVRILGKIGTGKRLGFIFGKIVRRDLGRSIDRPQPLFGKVAPGAQRRTRQIVGVEIGAAAHRNIVVVDLRAAAQTAPERGKARCLGLGDQQRDKGRNQRRDERHAERQREAGAIADRRHEQIRQTVEIEVPADAEHPRHRHDRGEEEGQRRGADHRRHRRAERAHPGGGAGLAMRNLVGAVGAVVHIVQIRRSRRGACPIASSRERCSAAAQQSLVNGLVTQNV